MVEGGVIKVKDAGLVVEGLSGNVEGPLGNDQPRKSPSFSQCHDIQQPQTDHRISPSLKKFRKTAYCP